MRTTRWSTAAALVAITALAGCDGSSTDSAPEPVFTVTSHGPVVFFTQNRVPAVSMEALFTGTIRIDDDGCLSPGAGSEATHTFAWPKSYSLDTSGSAPVVRDDQGEPVGAVGEEFTFAGGVVEELLASMGFTDEDRAAAAACPGRIWIVNPEGS